MEMQLVVYDVLSNTDDGYDVNNVYETDIYYTIGANDNDEDIVHKFKNELKIFPGYEGVWLKENADIELDWISENWVEIREKGSGYPLGRLEEAV